LTTAATSSLSTRTYFARALDAFELAGRRARIVTRECGVGGTLVRLHFAGAAMQSVFFPALAHLTSIAGHGPRLDVCVWDTASTGVAMPPPEWPLDAYVDRGEIRVFQDDIRAAFSVDGPTLELWDRTTGRAIVWAADRARVPSYDWAAPARRLFSWWLAYCGLQMIHAGAVGTADGCVLIAGKGGSGKSNTALACLENGLAYLADDYCALEPGDVPVAHSLYGTGKVHADDLDRLTFLAGKVGNADRLPREKALVFLEHHFKTQLTSKAVIKAIVLPRVDQSVQTSIAPASSAEAVRAIAVSTIAQLPYAGGEVLRAVADLVRRVPSFRLHIGHDARHRVPAVMRSLASGDVGGAIG
jgi:hypothetical protein